MIGSKTWRLALLRRLLKRPPLRVGREEAVANAVAAWQTRPYHDSFPLNPRPVEELDGWTVWLGQHMAPIPFIEIDGQTGEVVSVGIPPL